MIYNLYHGANRQRGERMLFDEERLILRGEKQKEELTTKNTVAILFPYIRALVSNYTANANVPPLILPPINVSKILD